ncbi:MAG: hemin-degrading factor [Myxococcota bacterium]
MTPLRQRWINHLDQEPRARTVQVAEALGVTEAELLFARVGDDAVQLKADWQPLLEGLPAVGPVMCLTRNAFVVHESTGPFERVEWSPHMAGVFGTHIDQRLILGRWALAIAAPVETRKGAMKSIQVFDHAGTAVLKIYAQHNTDTEAWDALIADRTEPNPSLPAIAPIPAPVEVPDAQIDAAELRQAWANMTDTHQVHPLLRRLGVAREQALRLVGSEWAVPVAKAALDEILNGCAEDAEPVMVFVGNRGCIQIHSGLIDRVMPMGSWINVLDPAFNLHADRDGLARAWVVRKPTDRGLVLSLEVFSEEGVLLVQMFGQRTEDQSQRPSWHERLERLTHPTTSDSATEANAS